MAIYKYEIPYQMMLLHYLTGKTASLQYIEVTLSSQCISKASDGAIAGILKGPFFAQQAMQPVKTIYVNARAAKQCVRKKQNLCFEFNTAGESYLYNQEEHIHFIESHDEVELVNYDDIFPENEGIRSFAKFPLFAVNKMTSVLKGLNEQHINFSFYEEGDPAVSEYNNGSFQTSFVMAMA